jgi:hypothetical protein
MKYEGKLYGKIAGKYIEVKDHVSNDDLIEWLESIVVTCREIADEFHEKGMNSASLSSTSMANAYINVISKIQGKQ